MRKVVFIVNEYPPVTGGISTHAGHLAASLTSSCQVHVITFGSSATQQQNVTVTSIAPAALYVFTAIKRLYVTVRIMKTESPDVVLLSNRFPIWMGWLMSFFFRRPLYHAILHGNELLMIPSVFRWFTQYCLHRIQVITSVSDYTRSLLSSYKERKRCSVIHNALSEDWLHPVFYPRSFSGSLRLLTVGTIRKRKGHDMVIRAIPLLKKKFSDVQYTICGLNLYPAYTNELKRLTTELEVEDCVTFTFIPFEDTQALKHLYQNADVYMLLSKTQRNGDTEGYGISILEAHVMGVPAIGNVGCGVSDAIQHESTGLLVNGDSPYEVAAAIEKITSNYSFYSGNAIDFAQQQKWINRIKEYEAVWNSFIH